MRTTAKTPAKVSADYELTYWERWIDSELISIDKSIEFLLLSQPANLAEVRKSYIKDRHIFEPDFYYEKLPAKIGRLKERLIALPLNKVSDTTLASIFYKERDALKTMFKMLSRRGSAEYLENSIKLYGEPDTQLVDSALEILLKLPAKGSDELKNDYVDPFEFAEAARKEIAYYCDKEPRFKGEVVLRDEQSSIMVSNGKLFVGTLAAVPRCRVDATISHEIGAHMVTYWNGSMQPLGLLSTGFTRYEELQEGLAVFLEYLAGGLTRNRMRTLAARVVAVWLMQNGHGFARIFEELTGEFGIGPGVAFEIVGRTFRGGGMTRPAVYLGGLIWVLDYLQKGGSLETLFAGKFGTSDLPLIEEMLMEGKLIAPYFKPRILLSKEARRRLEKARAGSSMLDLVCDLPANIMH